MLAATAPAALPLAAIALRHLATSPQALALSNAAIQAYTQPTYTHSANTFPPSGSRAAGLRYFAEEAPAYAPVMTHAAARRPCASLRCCTCSSARPGTAWAAARCRAWRRPRSEAPAAAAPKRLRAPSLLENMTAHDSMGMPPQLHSRGLATVPQLAHCMVHSRSCPLERPTALHMYCTQTTALLLPSMRRAPVAPHSGGRAALAEGTMLEPTRRSLSSNAPCTLSTALPSFAMPSLHLCRVCPLLCPHDGRAAAPHTVACGAATFGPKCTRGALSAGVSLLHVIESNPSNLARVSVHCL
ncbi:MAG: hypothetical protein J3K34DRAFT_427852 [Monoraphidium minutum]|nr:MAG: hypothetical protein J3K34DRAFT_427852 [Monoraphidium minutum]